MRFQREGRKSQVGTYTETKLFISTIVHINNNVNNIIFTGHVMFYNSKTFLIYVYFSAQGGFFDPQ